MPGRRGYPPEFKAEAVELYRNSDQSIRDIGERSRDCSGVIAFDGWRSTKSTPASATAQPPKSGAELRQLRRENRRLKMERDILKGHGLLRQRERDPLTDHRFIAAEKANLA